MPRRLNQSIIGKTDSYKPSHWLQYRPGTQVIYSYFESRGGLFAETVFSGLYYILEEHLTTPITAEDIAYWKERWAKHFNDDTLFNEEGWNIILNEYDGKLPLRIRAVPEGTVVPTGNVLMTVENLDPRLPWLTNYVETLLCQIWYPISVATLSREAKEIITAFAVKTGADLSGVPFKLHDFGFRGTTCFEQSAIGGMAHLINFMGTDTAPGFELAKCYYGADMAGFSIPAAEHSTITSWGGPDQEIEAFANMVRKFGNSGSGLFAVVSDSYDIFNACENIWGDALYDEVRRAKSMLVVRPDSGHVLTVVAEIMEILGRKFGYTTNASGFKVLNNVRVIQGDGMNLQMIREVCQMMYNKGWSIDNIAFGMGGGLLQLVNRDTIKAAFKASAAIVDGVEIDVWKQPVTDPGKNSKRGRLSLVRDPVTGEYETRDWYETADEEDILQVVYEYGEYIAEPPKFSDIKARAELPELVTA